jgi:tRNA (guanosine-2'-O-)-methyltransferase
MTNDPNIFATPERIETLKKVLEKRTKNLTVILENINDPHNLSACLRSCDSVGINQISLIYHSGQPFPKLGKKSSGSARKWVDTIRYDDVESCFEQIRNEGKKIYTTHMNKDSVSLYDLDLSQPCALMFGNEHSGVSEKAVEMADANFLIPQIGMIQSLNISVACAVSVYEAFRQRYEKGLYKNMEINEKEMNELLIDWVRR